MHSCNENYIDFYYVFSRNTFGIKNFGLSMHCLKVKKKKSSKVYRPYRWTDRWNIDLWTRVEEHFPECITYVEFL